MYGCGFKECLRQEGIVSSMKEKIKVTGVPETMIQTLYARAKETRKTNAKIKDDIAVENVENVGNFI